ncbi:MAG: hypothetical protein JO027_14260 [Solirubrobacterales bacterium]|nr:hypothetical protein [Solirubrobacterales bacterium]
MRWRVGIGTIVCLVVFCTVAFASGATRPPLRFHEHFSALPYVGVDSSGRYTLFDTTVQGEVGVVLDELTGRQTTVWLPSDCPAPDPNNLMLGGAWLLEDCTSSRLDLYSLAGGYWQSMAVAPGCVHYRAGPGSSCSVYAVGTDWVEYDESSARLGDRFVFQNIASGALRRDPANAVTLADLSSPTLAHRLCRPLRVSRGGGSMIGLPGRFALAMDESGSVLERCGTRLHRPLAFDNGSVIDTWSSSDARTLVWNPNQGYALDGLFLPSLRPFTVSAPSRQFRAGSDEFASDRHIYLEVPPRSPTSPFRVLWAPLPQP